MSSQDIARSTEHVPGDPSVNAGENAGQLADVVTTPAPVTDEALPGPEDTPLPSDQAPPESGDTSLPSAEGVYSAAPPPTPTFLRAVPPFWHDRLVEAGLILSMSLYYLVGNANFGAGNFLHLAPYIYSLPFLAVFACLTWYRLAFAVALLPLALPYYMAPKTVFSLGSRHLDFSLIEISLGVCVLVALVQLLIQGKKWHYWLSWTDLRARLGPFPVPVLIFVAAALVSIIVAVDRSNAARAFREEVFDPLLYVLLAFYCLRTRGDLLRLLGAFLGSAMIVAVIGLVQYFFFANQLQTLQGSDGRVTAVYGNANSIGLFFDYILPLGLACCIFQVRKALFSQGRWWPGLLILVCFIPLVGVLVLSQSLGSALALPIALLFILALSIRRRRTLWLGTAILVGLVVVGGLVLYKPLTHFIANWHDNSQGISTAAKRYYLWLVAWHMIQHYPVFGVGMDNWLCHYSINKLCPASHTQYHYLLNYVNNQPTGLKYEPALSHPHDIFLQIWVSIGIFGLLAFGALLTLFYWLFARIVTTVRQSTRADIASLEWIVLGVGGAMLAALCQGLIDSSFLEQDLAFCFWMLVAALLILRVFTGTPWRAPKVLD